VAEVTAPSLQSAAATFSQPIMRAQRCRTSFLFFLILRAQLKQQRQKSPADLSCWTLAAIRSIGGAPAAFGRHLRVDVNLGGLPAAPSAGAPTAGQ